MNSRFAFWATLLILSLVTMGLCLRALALEGVPVSESLIVRGLSCLLLVIIFAHRYNLSLIPKALKTQVMRAGLAGLALTFLSLSYNWLTASTVSVLSNVDVPLLLVLGPLIGIRANAQVRALSLISIGFLVWYVSGLQVQINLLYGLLSLLIGSVLLCFGYLYIKKSMADENKAVAILTPALAIITYGVIELAWSDGLFTTWTPQLFLVCVLSGAGMFTAYVATMKLYELTDIATAEFPTLLSAIVIQPFEMVFMNEPIQGVYLVSSIGFVLCTGLIMNLQRTPHELANAK